MKQYFFAALLLMSCQNLLAQEPAIIPKPVSLKMQSGVFVLDASTSIIAEQKQASLQTVIGFLRSSIKQITGFSLPTSITGKRISLEIKKLDEIGEEGYLMQVQTNSITIQANAKAGLIYGIQSLLQTLPAIRTNAVIQIPCMQIKDYPRFQYRGMHLDVSRHFFGPDLVKQYIDLLATYKMNRFHWHLVDDQGWRLEIKKYPALTQVGAWRVDYTDQVWGNRPQAKTGEPATYGGYYTQEQVKEIIAYAAQKNVTIVPEIEMPGHVASAIAAYPLLSCNKQFQLPMTGGNYTNISSNYCAGNDSVYQFIDNVLDEVVKLFPSTYIHLGGDEVDKDPWKKCAVCQAKIKTEHLKDENGLQSYFMTKVETMLKKRNRKMIGWDEILEGGLAPDATVMSWRGEAGGIEAAKMKHQVVMTPGKPVYFDHYQAGPEGEPMAIGGMNTLKMVYDYEPIPKELSSSEAAYVMGAQANLWTEFITTASQVQYMVLPRMLALSEVLWTPKTSKNWDEFNLRLPQHFKGFGERGLNYSAGNFAVDIKPYAENGKLFVALSTEIKDAKIWYTTDGAEPNLQSMLYTGPIAVQSTQWIKAKLSVNNTMKGLQAAKQYFSMHQAVGKTVSYTKPYSKYYPAAGPNTLTDGVRGTDAIGKNWHGFTDGDLIATIDLGAIKTIQSISLGCLQHYKDWIFLPSSVQFEVSSDGINYSLLGTVPSPVSIEERSVTHDFKINATSSPIRFIRVHAKNNLCPKGHSGEGKPGWIFADELVVE
jgi:hexosaminidase